MNQISLGDLHGEVAKPLLCTHEVWGSNPGDDVLFTSAFFFSEIYGRHCLSYRVYALSDALGRKFAAQLRETLHMWGNLEYNEVSSIEKVLKSKYLARSCLESFFDSLPHPSCTIYTRDVLFVFCFIV